MRRIKKLKTIKDLRFEMIFLVNLYFVKTVVSIKEDCCCKIFTGKVRKKETIEYGKKIIMVNKLSYGLVTN